MEKPILFNSEMVQALLENRKTVTRRLIKPQIPDNYEYLPDESNLIYAKFRNTDGEYFLAKKPYMAPGVTTGKGGDILYVRETFNDIETNTVLYAADKDFMDRGLKEVDGYLFAESEIKWRPSIHMPKALARIFLRVTDVKVERLQDITELQAIKEGVKLPSPRANYVNSFIPLWNSTIKEKTSDYTWEADPWVWVVEFERLSQ